MPECDSSGNVTWPNIDRSDPCHAVYSNICLKQRLDQALNDNAVCESELGDLKIRERLRRRKRRASERR